MIIVQLIGGLGNQMFQYALGRRLALENSMELKLDITGFKTLKVNTPRKYELHFFNIQENFATESEIRSFQKFQKKKGRKNFLYNFLIADEHRYIKQGGRKMIQTSLFTRKGLI